jgi:RecB family endonuclease NucS
LVILELKNGEDRYVVPQLTRYYDALLEEKPFSDKIDYSQPVQLIAIAPTFHRDNFTDKKHHRLSIEFWQFQVLEEASAFYCQVQRLDANQTWRLPIPFQPTQSERSIPSPPRKLQNLLANSDAAERSSILKIRHTLLSFDERIQEIVTPTCIFYGKGKNKPSAELRRGQHSEKPALFLWLPHPEKVQICRMWMCDTDWQTVNRMIYCPNAFKSIRLGRSMWSISDLRRDLNFSWISQQSRQRYEKFLKNPQQATSLNLFVEIALDHWLERL